MTEIHNFTDIDREFMARALELAARGFGTTSPNPMVGAVIVKHGKIIGEGWHEKAGLPHAEANAVINATESVEDSTMYVTLEPCCHTKKRTPPCSNLLIENKIKKVIVAVLDPNPMVAGKGVKQLREAGLEVEVGLCESQAKEMNEVFFKNIQSQKPFIHLKLAQTLDGKVATLTGDSKWISDERARREVHELRLKYDAVMVGRSTLNNDNPKLNIRMGIESKGKTPWRIIVGKSINLDFSKTLLSTDKKRTILVTDKEVDGFKCITKPLDQAMDDLFNLGIRSILVEGGAKLASTILEEKLADKMTVYVAPKLIGAGKSYFEKENKLMSEGLDLSSATLRTLGNQAVYEVNLCSPA